MKLAKTAALTAAILGLSISSLQANAAQWYDSYDVPVGKAVLSCSPTVVGFQKDWVNNGGAPHYFAVDSVLITYKISGGATNSFSIPKIVIPMECAGTGFAMTAQAKTAIRDSINTQCNVFAQQFNAANPTLTLTLDCSSLGNLVVTEVEKQAQKQMPLKLNSFNVDWTQSTGLDWLAGFARGTLNFVYANGTGVSKPWSYVQSSWFKTNVKPDALAVAASEDLISSGSTLSGLTCANLGKAYNAIAYMPSNKIVSASQIGGNYTCGLAAPNNSSFTISIGTSARSEYVGTR